MNVWTTETADKKFSEAIRKRDPICKRCRRKKSTDCSHHFERIHSATRYNYDNCDGFCRDCHNYWHSNRPEYKKFKIDQLGIRRYIELQRLSATVVKRDQAIIKFMNTQ